MTDFVPRLFDYEASGNCLKVRLALRLLDRPFERVPTDIFAGDTLTDDYRRVNPMRTTPVLEIAPERFLAESNAILLHLAEGTDLLPSGPLDRAAVYRWLFFERTFTPAVGGLRFMRMTGRDSDGRQVAELEAEGRRWLGRLEEAVHERPFLAGDAASVADLSLYAYTHVAEDGNFEVAPPLRAWIERVEALPGFVNDLVPYPENARLGRSRSIYG
jgi:glutathione S-transferase